MELRANSLISEDDFVRSDNPPLIDAWQQCPPGWHKFEVAMDSLTFGDDSYLLLNYGDRQESIPLRSRRSLPLYAERPFDLTFSPPRPRSCSRYTVYTLKLLPIDRHDLARYLEHCLFGDRDKVATLMLLEDDADRWTALQDLIAKDVFYCADLHIQMMHPRDFSWEGDHVIRSHSYEPRFLVGNGAQPTASTLLRCEIAGGSLSGMLRPRIYVSDASGHYSESMGIRFPPMIEYTESERLVQVPRSALLQLNPTSAPGTVRISKLRFERSTVSALFARIVASTFDGGYREIPAIVRELRQVRTSQEQYSGRRGVISKFWLLYRRLSRALSSRDLPAMPQHQDFQAWLNEFLPSLLVLENYRAEIQRLGLDTRFSLVCAVQKSDEHALKELVRSVLQQVYGNWELLLVDDHSGSAEPTWLDDDNDPRIRYSRQNGELRRTVLIRAAIDRARGDYIVLLEAGDILEKHALYKFATTIQSETPDVLYADERIISDDINDTIDVTTRPAFSIDYYLSHPYFVHPFCVRRELAQIAGSFDATVETGEDLDFALRCLESARVITHIPDFLYLCRHRGSSAGHATTEQVSEPAISAIQRHLSRSGRDATARATQFPDVYDVRDRICPSARVAVIIPTRNNHELLRKAIDSCALKKGNVDIQIYVIDHESDDAETRRYLAELAAQSSATIIPYEGPFNFSAMNNTAVSALSSEIGYYLFLNNDVEAQSDRWIESMTATCSRNDVGVCGAMLLYPDDTIQHGGVAIGMLGAAEHSHKFEPYFDTAGTPSVGRSCAFVTRRDAMAVTAAAMMVRADVFHEAGGYDERLQVGFNDTDLCLRIFERGYKIIFDANIVLYHFESATRGTGATDPHPADTQRFRNKHRTWIEKKDLFYGANLSLATTRREFDPTARSQFAQPRTIIQPEGCYGKRYVRL